MTTTNGLGNLTIGYNAPQIYELPFCSDPSQATQSTCENAHFTWAADQRTGSHNLIVGAHNAYTKYGSLIAGVFSVVNGRYASIMGGNANRARGQNSVIIGGRANNVFGYDAAVLGGLYNNASGVESSVSGGKNNEATGEHSST